MIEACVYFNNLSESLISRARCILVAFVKEESVVELRLQYSSSPLRYMRQQKRAHMTLLPFLLSLIAERLKSVTERKGEGPGLFLLVIFV